MGQKTEKATPRRRKEAREKGNVLRSMDVNTAAILLAIFASLKFLGGTLTENLSGILGGWIGAAASWPEPLTIGDAAGALTRAVWQLLSSAAPLLGVAFLVALAVNVAQVGFLISTKSLGVKFSRINPMEGFKRIFSVRSVAELVKAVVKVTALGYVAYSQYRAALGRMTGLALLDVTQGSAEIVNLCMNMAFQMAMVLVAIAAADYFYQWWVRERDMRMSKEEVKQEFKQMEGDPQVKGRIRQKQRQMGMRRMMQAIPSASVVITNPTHYAIALRYTQGLDDAPVVVAKGKDFVAQRIKEEARRCGVQMVENRPLAQALFVFCEIGDRVPQDMYQAVAEVLAAVYRMKNPARAQAARAAR